MSLAAVPSRVVDRAKHLVLDGLGCGLVAARLEWSRRAFDSLTFLEGNATGDAAVWGWDCRTSPSTAALLNGTFIQGFELDDYHELGPLHSEACVLPAVLATADHLGGVKGARLLESAIVGFEVGPRVGMALGGLELVSRGWHSGSVFGPLASAAAVGKLRGLSVDALEDAIGIAATQAGGLMAAQYESMVKRMHSGFAARSGVLAAALAAGGFTGIKAVIERPYGGYAVAFLGGAPGHLERLLEDAGKRWEIEGIAVKPYAGMGGLHTSIEGALALRAREAIKPDEIASAEISVGHAMFHHAGWRLDYPATAIGAQMNLGYAVAVAFLDGAVSVPQYSPSRIDSPDVRDLMRRINVTHDEGVDKLGEVGRWTSKLVVRLVSGAEHGIVVQHPRGGRHRPLANDEMREKFRALTALVMSSTRAQEIEELVLDLEHCENTDRLSELLAGTVTSPY